VSQAVNIRCLVDVKVQTGDWIPQSAMVDPTSVRAGSAPIAGETGQVRGGSGCDRSGPGAITPAGSVRAGAAGVDAGAWRERAPYERVAVAGAGS
jgi:hypothetical protein